MATSAEHCQILQPFPGKGDVNSRVGRKNKERKKQILNKCLGIEKKIFKEIIIMHFHYITYNIYIYNLATPQHNNPCPGGHIIYNFGKPILGHHYYTLSLTEPCPGVEKRIF